MCQSVQGGAWGQRPGTEAVGNARMTRSAPGMRDVRVLKGSFLCGLDSHVVNI